MGGATDLPLPLSPPLHYLAARAVAYLIDTKSSDTCRAVKSNFELVAEPVPRDPFLRRRLACVFHTEYFQFVYLTSGLSDVRSFSVCESFGHVFFASRPASGRVL